MENLTHTCILRHEGSSASPCCRMTKAQAMTAARRALADIAGKPTLIGVTVIAVDTRTWGYVGLPLFRQDRG